MRRKYRKMATDPFAFYRGSDCLFYADAAQRETRAPTSGPVACGFRATWSSLTEPEELSDTPGQLGRATAKVHCVSDADDESNSLVAFQVEDAVTDVVRGREDEFVADVVGFAHSYAARARRDHALFVDAFRAGCFEGV